MNVTELNNALRKMAEARSQIANYRPSDNQSPAEYFSDLTDNLVKNFTQLADSLIEIAKATAEQRKAGDDLVPGKAYEVREK
jgi:hypothetical protein